MYIRCWISFCEADRMWVAISKLAELLQDTSLGLMSFGSWLIENWLQFVLSHCCLKIYIFTSRILRRKKLCRSFWTEFSGEVFSISRACKFFPHSGGMLCFDQTTKTQDGGDSVLNWSSQRETFGKELVERRETHRGGECEKDKEWVRGDLSVVGCMCFFFFL